MNIIKAVATVGGWTLGYRLTSFARDILQASALGAGVFGDAFSAAFKLANVLRKMFAEGAFNASFLPIFSTTLKSKGQDDASKLASQIFTCLTVLVGIITLICLYNFDWIIRGYASGFKEGSERFVHAVALGRISFSFVTASFIVAMLGGMLNTVNKFAVPSAVQWVLNICVILAILMGPLCFSSVAYTMCWATLLTGLIQIAILWYNVSKLGFKVRFMFKITMPEVKMFFKKLVSGALGAGVWQVNVVADISIASLLPTGCMSYLYYTEHVNAFPLGILGIAFSTALLPPLTKAVYAGNKEDAKSQLNLGLLFALVLTIPAVVILCSLHGPITGVIYGHGKFGAQDVAAASPALAAFAMGLPAYMLTKVLTSAFFAHKNTKIPFRGGVISIVTNLLFIGLLLPLGKHNGIALATSISSWFNALYLLMMLKTLDGINVSWKTWGQIVLQCGVAVAMLASIVFMNNMWAEKCYLSGGLVKSGAVLGVSVVGLLIFYGIGKLFGIFKFIKGFQSVAKDS